MRKLIHVLRLFGFKKALPSKIAPKSVDQSFVTQLWDRVFSFKTVTKNLYPFYKTRLDFGIVLEDKPRLITEKYKAYDRQ